MPYENLDILVLLRECSDPRPPARTITRGAGISDRGLRRLPNPADLIALEEALCLKDRLKARVTVLAIGKNNLDDMLRLAFSLGADRGIRVWDHDLAGADTVADARVLARIMEILKPDMTFSGNRLIDRGDDPVPALASSLRDIACISSVVALTTSEEGIQALRKVDKGGRQKVAAQFPCTVLFEEGECPRYPSVEAVTAALAMSVEVWNLSNLGLPFRQVGTAGSYLSLVEFGVPRRDPVRVATPDARLPAFERIISMLSGGIKAREGKQHKVSADATANQLWQILEDEGLVPGSTP